jgi:polysaccharide export outer membrane protein
MRKFLLLYFSLYILSSCVSSKDILYLQDLNSSTSSSTPGTSTTIKKDDLLKIVVTSENMLSVKSFNQYSNSSLENPNSTTVPNQSSGYLVNDMGNIEFPIIGTLKLSGLTISEATAKLKDEISAYVVEDVTIDLRILNYKITVLGEVNVPGTYNLQGNRTTIFQALGYAGDLTIYGNRKTILITREVDGVQLSQVVDLTSKEIMTSEYYYIQQNDIIIVHPNNAQIQSAGFNRNLPIYVSIASLLLSIILIISRN